MRAAPAVAAVAALLAACAPATAPIPPASTRPAAFVRCPDIALTTVPPGLTRTDSVVEALYDNHMGYVITYSDRDGRRQLKTFSGVDLLDVLDDLDFIGRDVRVGRRGFVLHRTTAIPDMLVAEVQGAPYAAPCNNLFVQSRYLSRSQLLGVLRGLQLRQAG
ncbi:MAG TPA: hypothetical protein VFR67_19495 [Pilimelia sp.]|nr:hypothetical protein [Pilimelia sp.]